MTKLAIHLVTWNGEKYVPFLLESLRKQTFQGWKLRILDNSSSDKTIEMLEKGISLWPETLLIKHEQNFGFAEGHNKLFPYLQEDYCLLLNQDMYLLPNCLEELVNFIEKNQTVGAVTPRLMKWNSAEGLGGFTDKVDSLGLKVKRNRQVVELGAGVAWGKEACQQSVQEVFGVSGALPLFRSSALGKVALKNNEIFDSRFHSYKEDVDLAFRLRSAGYASFVLYNAVAYHNRGAGGLKNYSDAKAAINKLKQSSLVRYYSYRNHLITLYKNEYWQNLLLDFPWIFWYEFKKLVYFVLFDRSNLQGLVDIWKMWKELKVDRTKIKELRTVNWKEMRRWINRS